MHLHPNTKGKVPSKGHFRARKVSKVETEAYNIGEAGVGAHGPGSRSTKQDRRSELDRELAELFDEYDDEDEDGDDEEARWKKMDSDGSALNAFEGGAGKNTRTNRAVPRIEGRDISSKHEHVHLHHHIDAEVK